MVFKISPLSAVLLLALLAFGTSVCGAANTGQFDKCEDVVRSILNGTLVLPGPLGEIDNITIYEFGYMYEGHVMYLKPSCPRSDLLTLTLDGCRAICGSQPQLAEPAGALSLTATWVFPLGIIFSLPYEAHRDHKVWNTLKAVFNWLGGAPAALTAILWNVGQIRRCRRRAAGHDDVIRDAFYVLSCFNQFDFNSSHKKGKNHKKGVDKTLFFKTLIYGLFRPRASLTMETKKQLVTRRPADLADHEPLDMILTRDLLIELAFQLRMLRRKMVIPVLTSLAVFLVAYVFSVVLAFGDLDKGIDVVYMSIGLFVLWLPVLVAFGIIDRNPTSSERTAELLTRWLHNVAVVREWAISPTAGERNQGTADGLPNEAEIHGEPDRDEVMGAGGPHDAGNSIGLANLSAVTTRDPGLDPPYTSLGRLSGQWWHGENEERPESFYVGQFVGQGRTMHYCALVDAVMTATRETERFKNHIDEYDARGAEAAAIFAGPKSRSWYKYAFSGLLIVWVEIMMATGFAFMTPTVGPGCWSGSCFLYGALSTISWGIQFWKRPPAWLKGLAYFANGLAFLWLIAVIAMQLSGAFFNCYCLSSPIASALGWGRYMSFGNASEFRDKFDLLSWWIGFATIGGLVPIIACTVAFHWWRKGQHMWRANQRGGVHADENITIRGRPVRADMTWLTRGPLNSERV
ncbi:hypothetical protein B0T14DRAFT_587753 [Immersiella caudata]|uniref:Uncharacterized protein n=1 Tax=Immersiella caudata TaxID=314043 RepID=A0AA40C0X4_9PEZI|nr:hypothetical protein B0T14DRAFT_587753 [Immersiella caudata]